MSKQQAKKLPVASTLLLVWTGLYEVTVVIIVVTCHIIFFQTHPALSFPCSVLADAYACVCMRSNAVDGVPCTGVHVPCLRERPTV